MSRRGLFAWPSLFLRLHAVSSSHAADGFRPGDADGSRPDFTQRLQDRHEVSGPLGTSQSSSFQVHGTQVPDLCLLLFHLGPRSSGAGASPQAPSISKPEGSSSVCSDVLRPTYTPGRQTPGGEVPWLSLARQHTGFHE